MGSENWKDVVGFEGIYSVSSSGQIRRELAAKGTRAGRAVRLQKSGLGYWNCNLSRAGKVSTLKVHAVVAAAFLGPRPNGYEINHIDGNKVNNVVQNLEYVSAQENQRHAHRTKLNMNHGETHYRARLSDAQVAEIRRIFAAGTSTQQTLACRFVVGPDHISRIVNHKVRRNQWG